MTARKRYDLNVPGDFYVEDQCCLACGVPGVTAPDLFGGFDETGKEFLEGVSHCWVKKQPRSAEELDAMVETMATQEVHCIRYSGSDPAVITRIRNAGEGASIDDNGPTNKQAG